MIQSFFSSLNSLCEALKVGIADWGILHPSIVHIPIGILFAVPIFLALAIIFKKEAKVFLLSTLVLLILGTAGLYLATFTGEHAASSVQLNDAIHKTLETHYHLAEDARLYFSILTGLLLAYLIFISKRREKLNPRQHLLVQFLLLVFCLFNLTILLNAAHMGGKLVHYHGISSSLYEANTPTK